MQNEHAVMQQLKRMWETLTMKFQKVGPTSMQILFRFFPIIFMPFFISFNSFIDLQSRSLDRFLYDRDLHYERVESEWKDFYFVKAIKNKRCKFIAFHIGKNHFVTIREEMTWKTSKSAVFTESGAVELACL